MGKIFTLLFSGVGAAIIGPLIPYILQADNGTTQAPTAAISSQQKSGRDSNTAGGDITINNTEIRPTGPATIILENRKYTIEPTDITNKGQPTYGNIIDYDIGLIKSPGLTIEHLIHGRYRSHMYDFSVDQRVDSQFKLCDVDKYIKVILLTSGNDELKNMWRSNPKGCSDMATKLSPGSYRLKVLSREGEASNYSLSVELANR